MQRMAKPTDHHVEIHSNYNKALDDFYNQNFRDLFESLENTAESLRTNIFYANQYPNSEQGVSQTIALIEGYLNAPYMNSKVRLFHELYTPAIQFISDFENVVSSLQRVKSCPTLENAIKLEEQLALLQAKVQMSIAEKKDFYDKEYLKNANTIPYENSRGLHRHWLR